MTHALSGSDQPQTLALTAAQQGLWFAQQLDPENPSYNVAEFADIPGPVDAGLLRSAVRQAAGEMEALRLTFGERDGRPFQSVAPECDIDVPLVDLTGHPDPHGEAVARMNAQLAVAADLASGPLVRMTLYRLAPDRHLFHQQVHHLALDGYGAALALNRIAELYTESPVRAAGDATPAVRDLPLAPLLAEELAYRSSVPSEEDRRYWAGQLAGAPAAVGVTEATAPLGHGFLAVRHFLGAAESDRLRAAAKRAGVAWPTLFMAAQAVYLHRVRGLGEVVLGLPVTARRTPLARATPAMLSQVLPLRVTVSPSDTVAGLAKRISGSARAALKHQRHPVDALRRDAGLASPEQRLTGPAVNVLAFDGALPFGPYRATLHYLSLGPVEDMTLSVHASAADQGLHVDLLGNPDVHTAARLRGHHARILGLLTAFAADPGQPVGALRLLDATQEQTSAGLPDAAPRLLDAAQEQASPHGQTPAHETAGPDEEAGLTVSAQFSRQVLRTPGRTAVVSGDVRLTFGALDARVSALTEELAGLGAAPGTRVAVGLRRSTDLVVALLAVLRTGAAYVPIDPSYPAERIAHMIEDSAPVALVAGADTVPLVDPAGRLARVDPADPPHAPHAGTRGTRPAGPEPRDAAYVIYTSGSTGRPKGVVVEHRSLSNLLAHHRREAHALAQHTLAESASAESASAEHALAEHAPAEHALAEHALAGHASAGQTPERGLRVALTAATSFDASWDPLLWMIAGHELHVVDDDTRRDPQALVEFLVRQRIDAIETTPTYLRQLLSAGLCSGEGHRPRVIALGGEAVDDDLWRELADRQDLLVFNYYGPTEATVDAVTARVTGAGPVVGRPVAGARAHVLDSALQPLPHGMVGELYLSGRGVARGYHGRTGLTAGRFLPDPYGAPGARMYRTGDLARWNEAGDLEFVGRSDQQIKVRGHRVEVGEIEAVLRAQPGVAEAAVTQVETAPLPGPDGSANGSRVQRLAAYLVPDTPGQDLDPVVLRSVLAGAVPEYMVPTAYAVVPRLPLTPNGKLDTGQLPEALPVASDGGEPRTPREARLCAVFARCLGMARVGRDDNFFLLGGHSLLANTLVGLVRDSFGVEIGIRTLFEAPTPAGLLARLGDAAPARRAIRVVRPRPERLPLSFGQQRLWLLEKMGEAGTAYHLPVALRLSGTLDRAALTNALRDLVRRHESLRTVFPEDDEGPRQCVLAAEEAAGRLVVDDGQTVRPDPRPFVLEHELPVRARLFARGPEEHVLLLTLHHIAVDGWSMRPLLHDLAEAYTARLRGDAPDWEPLPVQYADHALHVRELLGDPGAEGTPAHSQLAHQAAELHALPTELTFPKDRARPTRPTGRGGRVGFDVPPHLHRELLRLAAGSGASTFMVLHAALAALMTRLGAGEDVAIGTPVAGRDDPQLADIVGFFVNTLVLRTDTSGAPGFDALLARVRDGDLRAYAHQDIPFERIVEELAPSRALSRHPLFQVMLSLNNAPAPRPDLPGLTVSHEATVGRGDAKFDLTWDLTEQHDDEGGARGIRGELEYSEDLFDRATAQRYAGYFVRLLEQLLAHPQRPFTDAEFLTERETALALGEIDALPAAAVEVRTLAGAELPPAGTDPSPAASGVPTPAGAGLPPVGSGPPIPAGAHAPRAGSATVGAAPDRPTVVHALDAMAATEPGRTAVVADDATLSFGEVARQALHWASVLHAHGVRHGDRVAVALPRTALQITALLGVLRAGAVYVPLDATHPRTRNALILESAAPRTLLTTTALRAELPYTGDVLCLDEPDVRQSGAAAEAPRPPRPCDAAYVLHTSGSTGRPKGVVVTHHSLANLLAAHREQLIGPAESDNNGVPLRVALTAAMTFDAAWDPLLWMLAGHELHLVDDVTRRDPEALTTLLHARSVDVVETTPSFLEQLRACGLFAPGRPRPRVLALGGEAVGESLWRELGALDDVAVWNLYGPTEATVDTLTARLRPGTGPHLGRPVRGTRARVLDARLRPAAPGVTGELYLTGPALARGYDRRTGATAERFLPDPYGPPGERMYRTGDLVRHRAGRLEFVGRADGQVKVRGFRVETGEVAAALAAHPGVSRAAATVRRGPDGAGRLVAWVVPAGAARPSPRELRALVAARLPAYMVPAVVVPVPGLPLTVHGKIDFDALPEVVPEAAARDEEALDTPHTAQEEILCALFADSLGHDRVARNDDFFELGGHSLLATRLIGRIRAAFGVELPVRALFENTTPAALAQRLADAAAAHPALRRAERPVHPPLSPAQRRLWFLHQLDPESDAYHISVAVRLRGALDEGALRGALADVVSRHESLRTLMGQDEAGEPFQDVLDPGDARPDLPVTPLAEPDLADTVRAVAAGPFDLTRQIPLRAHLFRHDDDRHTLLMTAHHIAADGWSMGPLAQDLAGAYAARRSGRAPHWEPLPVQYVDYTLWQRDLLGGTDRPDSLARRQLAYWSAQLEGLPEETALPLDRPRPTTPGGRGGTVPLRLPAAAGAAVAKLAQETSTTPFMVLHAALAVLLGRIGGSDDVTVGTPVAGRTDEALDGLVGFFVNTLALRVRLTGAPTFRELLDRVRETDLAAYAHQELPFERLVEELRPARSLTRHPMFQVMLALNNTRAPRLELPGLKAQLEGIGTGGAKFDLSFSIQESALTGTGAQHGEAHGPGTAEESAAAAGRHRLPASAAEAAPARLDGTLEFNRDLFEESTARRIADMFGRLLVLAVAGPGTPVGDLPLLTDEEEAGLLALGEGPRPGAEPPSVLDRFASTVAASRSGDIAVHAPDGQLSFSALDTRSDRIAALLATTGVAPGDRVAVLLPRSTDSIAALLGVLKWGAVYTAVDPSLPQGRVDSVLADAAPRAVLTSHDTDARVPQPWVRVNLEGPAAREALTATPPAHLRPVPRQDGPVPAQSCGAQSHGARSYGAQTAGAEWHGVQPADAESYGVQPADVESHGALGVQAYGAQPPGPAPYRAQPHAAPERADAVVSAGHRDTPPAVRPAEAPAYLIHTSGSTGRPKGVLVGHRSLARLLDHHRQHVFAPAVRAAGRARLRVALTAALSFDASWDPILWMIEGHELHVVDDSTRRDTEALVEHVRSRRLDVLESTPTHVRQLLDAGLLVDDAPHRPSVVVLGGEAVPADLWRTLRQAPGVRCWNFYGPTEATVDTLVGPLDAADRPVLGSPVTGTRVLLLDRGLRPVPQGVTGDLYLAGDSLALGYHGRPGETARAFVPDPYGPPGSRMYRTGDLARRAADGELEFAGRSDGQVKVRGFRVEPDEIAAVITEHPSVAECAVTVHEGPAGTRLAAHVVPAHPLDADDLTALREHTARHLPAYMVPAAFRPLASLPLTASGKVDRKALPEPEPAPTGTDGRTARNPREDVLCGLFAETLGVERVTIDDDFFALGGHSLLATRLIGSLRGALGVEISIRTLFEAPTVAALAARLADGTQDNPLATLLPLRTAGDLPPLFCVHPAGGLAWSYAGLLPHLERGRPLYGLQTPNLDGHGTFPDSIEAMAACYVAELRTVQPSGPYHLLGWSFGGNVVQEIAVQLQEAGQEVALLTILDAFPLAPLDDLDAAPRDTVFRALLANLGVGDDTLDASRPVEAVAVRDAFRGAGSPLGSLEPRTIDAMVDNFAGQARLMRAYTPRVFHGQVLFFEAVEGRPRDAFSTRLWEPYVEGGLDVHEVPFAHAQLMSPAAREQIGPTVADALRALGHPRPPASRIH